MGYRPRHRWTQVPGIETKDHWFLGTVWTMRGKTEDYEVTMEPRGFSCTCPGFTFHGKCRHISRVGDALLGITSIHEHAA